MKSKTPLSVSTVPARLNPWQKIRPALLIPFLALGMLAGLLVLLNQPTAANAAATLSTPIGSVNTNTTSQTRGRAPLANILYVTTNGSGAVCTIAQPCTLQDAVNASSSGDEIHVAAGLYNDVYGNGVFTQTVQVNKTITLRGGYTSTNWLAEPDPVANETILDGNNQGRVIYIFAAAPTIEGFTIRNGRATIGGGIYKVTIQGSLIQNNRIYNNTAIGGGASGAGIYTQGNDTILNNEIYDNDAVANGAGIYATNSAGSGVVIQNNRIYNNTAGAAGGSTIGGGIFLFSGIMTVDGNEIFGNEANLGGGIGSVPGTTSYLQNNFIYNNRGIVVSTGAGGGILAGGNVHLIHNTIVDNMAPSAGGGGIFAVSAVVHITNSIVASNTGTSNAGIFSSASTISGANNNIFNNATNVTLNGTITSNPRFASYSGDNFHLSASSTALINTGHVVALTNDIDGQLRPFAGGYDIGGDEFYDPALTCFARVNEGPIFTSIQSALATVTQASDIVKVAGRCRDTDTEVVLLSQSLILRGGYTTTDWINQDDGPTIIDAQGVSGRRGIRITAGSPTVDALHITGGTLTSGNGSAIYVSGGANAVLQNLVLYGNTTAGTNGALGVASGTNPTVQFNTIVNNSGIGVRFEGTGAIHNSILYGNSSTAISGGFGHTFNLINVNPQFVNAAANNYHLTALSPAIGAADPNAALSRDFEGNTRPLGNHFDAGADEANEFPAVSFEPGYADEVDRGTVVAIDHVLTNLGTEPDTFTLSGNNNLNWDINFPTTSGLLAPGEGLQVTVVITVPAGALPQQVGVTIVTATSTFNTSVHDTVVDTLTVAQVPGIQFTPTYSNALLPGEAITYTHTLTNTGDYSDTFAVELENDPFGWAELIPDDPFTVTLAAGENTPVVVVVTVPEFAAAGFADTIMIRATSTYSPAITAVVTDTVTAKPTVGTRYVSNSGFDLNNNCTQLLQPCRTVGQAVSQASFGDAIRIATGTYAEADITVNDTMYLSGGWTNNFTAQTFDPTTTVINAAQEARIFSIAPGTQPSFAYLSLENGLSSAVGGAVWIGNGAQPDFDHVHFLNNQSGQGGAIYAEANTNTDLVESRFVDNVASRNGGAFFLVSGSSLISATAFVDNIALGTQELEGGGALYQQAGTLTVLNGLFASNSSAKHGGAIFARNGQATIEFSTIVENTAAGSGSALYSNNAAATLRNSIIANNNSVSGGALFRNTGSIPNSYNLFWNNLPDNGNVTPGSNSVFADPEFADPAYRLSPDSIAVDAADPTTTLEVDFERDARPADSGFDMGYDELAGCLAKRGATIYASIQEAVDAGTGGNLIQVSGICRGAQGQDIGGGVIVSQTVFLTQALIIEGGWNSSFTSNFPLVPTYIDPQGQGRGIYISGTAGVEIHNITIINGDATGLGGGPTGQSAGGGIYNLSSDSYFGQIAIINSTAQVGGGLYLASSTISFTGSAIISGTATIGGGLYNNGGITHLSNSGFLNNTSTGNGGGAYSIGGEFTVLNVVFAENAAASGAGIYLNNSPATLLHLTMYDNNATSNGGGIYQTGNSSTIRNGIFASNNGASGPAIFITGGTSSIDYNYYYDHLSNPVIGGVLGANSVNTNVTPPGLVDPALGDFHLLDNAAALDIADPNSPVLYDIDLDPRPSNQGFDMGADELAGCYARVDGIIYGSIQRAIQVADPGDQIDVAGRCGGVHTYNAGGTLGVISTTVHITKNVTLEGGWRITYEAQDDVTVIDPGQNGFALFVAPGITSTVKNFHLINGNGNAPGLNGNGGAIYIHNASPQILGNNIYSNTATSGSAIYIDNASPVIGGGNRVYSNTATNGSIYINNTGATATIVNNFISGNTVTNNGAGLYHQAGAANIWHNNFINNEAVNAGGAIYVAAASPNIRNNIILGNAAATTGGIRCNTGATPVINYNDYFTNTGGDVSGAACTTGANGFFVDPLFINAPIGNYNLQDTSPMLDVGDPTMTLLVDYEDRIRPSHQGFDIGAYEFGGCYARNLDTPNTIFGSVQWAVDQAAAGDTIQVDGICYGVNTQTVSGNPTTQNLFINKDITIDGLWNAGLPGSGDGLATLQPQEAGRVVYVASGRVVTLTNILLFNGDANGAGLSNNGGGVYNTGNLILDTVTIRFSLGANGAGIYNVGPLLVNESIIQENNGTNGGGLYNNYSGQTSITGTQIALNVATNSGGGVYQNLGTLLLEDNQINGNIGSVSGGGVYQNTAVLRLLRNTIYSNSASGNGGGIYLNATTGANQVYNNFIYDNEATLGGGLYNATTNTGIWHNTFVDNTATGTNGGAIFSAGGNLVIRNNIVHDNTGTGIHVIAGSPTIGFNNVVGNSAAGYGGTASDSGGGIAQAPDYVNAANRDYHLDFGSSGIDVGDPAAPVAVDIDADNRPNNDEFDMGADEVNACLIRVETAIFTHLQDAINYAEANNFTTVEIARGECRGVRPDPVSGTTLQVGYVRENIHFIGSLRRTDFSDPDDFHNLLIRANSSAINAENQGRVIVIGSSTAVVTFTHVALVNGNAFQANDGNDNGGALYNLNGSVETAEANFCGSQAVDGGGYYGGSSADAYLSGGSIGSCRVAEVSDGDVLIGYDLYSGNSVSGNGGGVFSQGGLDMSNIGIYRNSAGNHGGGVYNTSAAATLINVILYDNLATANGGGLYNTGNSLEIYHNTIRDNNAQNGGGVFNTGTGLVINSTIVATNTATTTGGGIHTVGGNLGYNNFYQNSPNDSTIGVGTAARLGDPGFAAESVFHLAYTSDNIDTADSTLVLPPLNITFDGDLDFRPDAQLAPHNGPWEYRSDIGADEYAKTFLCELLPESQSQAGPAGSTVFHIFNLINKGSFTDTITITLQSSTQGWATLVGGPQAITMAPFSNYTVTLSVAIPLTATTNMADTSVLHCDSHAIPGNSDIGTATTTVELVQGVLVEQDQTAFAFPSEVLTFTHVITNVGNRTEDIQIIPNSGPQFATASLYNLDGSPFFPDTITLDAGEAISLLLQVTMFDDAMGGGVATPGVIARLAAAPTIFDAAQNNITIGFVPGTRYLAASGAVDNSNCTSPNNPCATLQHAVNQALNGDDLLLSAGSYTDYSTRTLGANVIQQTAFVDKDLSITGGYNAGDGYTTFQPITNSVTLDGQGNGRIFYLTSGIDVILTGLFMEHGYEASFGGAIYNTGANLSLQGNWVQQNRAEYGGGIYHLTGTLTINSSVFAHNLSNNEGNTSPGEGGAIYVANGSVILENNTFADNEAVVTSFAPTASGNGGAIFQADGSVNLQNNIFSLNQADGSNGAYYFAPAVNILANDYNLFFGNTPNNGNVFTGTHSFTANPLFADTLYHLGSGSQAIDAGTTAVTQGPDMDGEPRLQGIGIDIGADELTQVATFAFTPVFQSALISSGDQYTYTHILTNTGDFADSYTLAMGHNTTGGTGWGYSLDPLTTNVLDPGESIQVTLVITGANPGYVDTTVITATSTASNLSLVVTDETTISQVAGVNIEPPRMGDGLAGGTVQYTHLVTNTGDGPDSFNLTVASATPPGWVITINPTNTGVLLPGDAAAITVTLQIPLNVTVTLHTATIQAASVVNPAVTDSVVDTTNIYLAGALLEPDHFQVVDPGTVITYNHTLTNTGNVSDTIVLTYTSSLGWLVSVDPMSATLEPGEGTAIVVVVSVPVAAAPGTQDDSIITARSTFNPLITDTATDNTRVTQDHGLTFTPDLTQTVPANTVVVYTHILTNTGNGPDTFAITATSNQGWNVQTPANLTLNEGASATVLVTLTVPTTGPVTDTMQVTATSVISPAYNATVTDTTIVTGPVPIAGVNIEADQIGSGVAGTQVVYQHTITNTGNIPDTFSLTYDSSLNWTVTIVPDSIPLDAGESTTVQVTVNIPGGTASGTADVTTVTATSTFNPTVSDAVIDTTTVNASGGAGVLIEPDNTGADIAGTTVLYQHTITNTGANADTFTLTIASSEGWTVDVGPDNVALDSGETGTVAVTVTIPAGATSGISDITTVTATSSTNPNISDIATDTTQVLNVGAGVLIGPDQQGQGTQGSDVVYTHWVTNTGNITDSFLISPISSNGWSTIANPNFFSLAPGERTLVTVTLSIPVDATIGTTDVMTISASSTTPPNPIDTAIDLTEVIEGVSGGTVYLPLVLKPCVPTNIDLVVTSLEIVPANPQAGQQVTVRITIRNQGTVGVTAGNNFFLDFYVDRVPEILVAGDLAWGIQGSWMAAGASRTLTANYTFTAGTHQLWAQVDTDNTVAECPNELNNLLGPVSLTVTGAAGQAIPVITPIAPSPLDMPRPTPTPLAPGEQDNPLTESTGDEVINPSTTE